MNKNDIVNWNVIIDTYISMHKLQYISPVGLWPLYTDTAREVLTESSGL
jgi:hypothetical protein